jgi:hypothetical protein
MLSLDLGDILGGAVIVVAVADQDDVSRGARGDLIGIEIDALGRIDAKGVMPQPIDLVQKRFNHGDLLLISHGISPIWPQHPISVKR